MNLHTKISIKKELSNPIDYHSKILLLGSCFSENIGNKFAYYKFQTIQNPLGILFHPKAIENLIRKAIHKKEFSENDFFFQNEQWHSFEAHSSVSTSNKNELLTNLNSAVEKTKEQLKAATHIIITLGTSWVYTHLEKNVIVANCHKTPQKQFSKKLLTVDEITESLTTIITNIKSINTKATILFTVSPVRHLKDGFIENTQSKAHLITAIHKTIKKSNASYFPSYELMMDELRDYRFYKEDMIHPNATAINYIWGKFIDSWVLDTAKSTMQEVASIQKGMAHKPFYKESEKHLQFLKVLEEKKQHIKKEFPKMTF